MSFPTPFNEAARLRSLHALRILDSAPEQAFDLLTGLARSHFGVPMALISLVDEDRQWFKSAAGLDISETPRDVAFCAHAIVSERSLVVENALADPRFAENPLVTDDPKIRFYAGAPLITADGFRIGTFCVMDLVPRHDFADAHCAALADFARLAVELMDLRRQGQRHAATRSGEDIAVDAQMDLFSIVAHEIRSPMAALTGLVRAVADEAFGPVENNRYLQCTALMVEAADYLMQVTDRMLDFARLRTGDVAIKEEVVAIPQLFDATQLMTRHLQEEKQVSLSIDTRSGDAALLADRGLTLQMLINLVGNAIKYGPPGATVALSAERTDNGCLALVVADSGRGMSSEEIGAALKPYGRLVQPGQDDPGGMGIGLPLVKRLIEAHGGRLDVRSAVGVGTVARLVFPAYRVRSAPMSPKDAA